MTIPLFKVFMSNDAKENVGNVLLSGMITQGSQVEKFENELKKFFNYPYVLTLNSATSGLTLAYRLLNLKKTDVVISTPLTCFATNAAIMAHELDIVWADVDPKTCNIDIADTLRRVNKNTRVLSIVHWGGNPVNMDQVNVLQEYIQNKYGHELYVVEDCAHAFGAEWNGKKLGTTGNSIAVYSLQAIKHLTTGDGGIILLPNEEMYNRAKLLRWYGIDRTRRSLPGKDFRLEPDIPEFGYKFHMNDITATIGLCNLPHMENNLRRCAENGAYYNEKLRGITGLELLECPDTHTPYYWVYTFKVLFDLKNDFISFMENRNIVVSQIHTRNDRHSCMAKFCKDFSSLRLINLNKLEKQMCSIPVGWWLTDSEREHIVETIREFFENNIHIEQLKAEDIEKYQELLFHMNGYMSEKYNEENIKGVYVIKSKDNRLISTAKLHIEKKIYDSLGHIQDVVTQPDMRGRGYGKTLVNFLTDKGMQEGCYKIVLSSIADMSDFYESCGFVRSGYAYTFRKEPNGNDLFGEMNDVE
jgi:dTDP-4-amino-4,6-dideoxygalactose transaminase/N-acetylglutamate synthase-like GNAT family acetyltransferase